MWGGTDEERSIRTICAALDRGITLIDTAPAYGQGRSEEIVGKALERWGRRDRVVWPPRRARVGSAEVVAQREPGSHPQGVEDSLRRLSTDHIDIYQVHWPDPCVAIEETAEALYGLYRRGLIRAIGVSNYPPERMEHSGRSHRCTPRSRRTISSSGRRKRGCCPIAPARHPTITYGAALSRPALRTHAHRERFEGDDLRQTDPKFQPPRYTQYLGAVAALDRLRIGAIRQERPGARRPLGARSTRRAGRALGRPKP